MKKVLYGLLAMTASFILGFIVGLNTVVIEEHIIVPGIVVDKPRPSNYI